MSNTYHLACTVCPHEQAVDGVEDALDDAQAHQRERGPEHFVDVHLIDDGLEVENDSRGSTGSDVRVGSDSSVSDGGVPAEDDG